jgi:hypothetical protein
MQSLFLFLLLHLFLGCTHSDSAQFFILSIMLHVCLHVFPGSHLHYAFYHTAFALYKVN